MARAFVGRAPARRGGGQRDDEGSVRRFLRVFAWGRLGLVQVLVVVAPLIPRELVPSIQPGLLVLSFVMVVLSSGLLLLLGSPARAERLAWLLCSLDAAVATAIVAGTGGPRSLFTFLYVPTVTVATVLLSRPGGLAVAGLSTLLYAGIVLGRTVLPLSLLFDSPLETTPLEVLTIFVNAGTFLIVAVVAGGLAEQFRATRHQLEVERQTVEDLAAFQEVILHSVGVGFIALDVDGKAATINRAAEAITGLTSAQIVGRPWQDVVGSNLPLAADTERPDTPPHQEVTLVRQDGTRVPVRLTYSVLRAPGGQPLGHIAVCEDLTEVRVMEERMRQADRLATLGRLAANIAHEIRNPLASVSGAIEILSLDTTPSEERRWLTQIVLRESDRLNQIIGNLIEYARPAPLQLERIDVGDMLDEIVRTLDQRTRAAGISVARDFPPSLRWRADPQRLRQAIWNLCLNAVDAMPDGGALRVGAAEEPRGLAVRVSDSGEGIAAEHLPHVFEPFFTTKPGGSGLGLALVQRVAQDHGGDVDVMTMPGHGTTFTLRLPRHDG